MLDSLGSGTRFQPFGRFISDRSASLLRRVSGRKALSWLSALLLAACAHGSSAPAPDPASPPSTPVAHLEVRGDGPLDLVLIPGSPCDWRVWEAFMERNAQRYTMFAVTLPGFSGTAPPPLPDGDDDPTPWFSNAIAALRDLLDERGLDEPVLVGHSLGGHLALRFGIEHPGRAAALVSIDGLPAANLGRELTPQERIAKVDADFAPRIRSMGPEAQEAMQRQGAAMMVTDPERATALAEMFLETEGEVAVEYLLQGMKADLRPVMNRLVDPTLVIAALSDQLPEEGTEGVRKSWRAGTAAARDLDLVFFDDTRHFVMDDRPAELDRELQRFLSALTERPQQP